MTKYIIHVQGNPIAFVPVTGMRFYEISDRPTEFGSKTEAEIARVIYGLRDNFSEVVQVDVPSELK